MNSVTHGTAFSGPHYSPVGRDVQVSDTTLPIILADDRALNIPIADWPFLASATPKQRQHWQFEPGNEIIFWPDLDDGLEIAHLLGLPIA